MRRLLDAHGGNAISTVAAAGIATVIGSVVVVPIASADASPPSCVTSLSTDSTQCYASRAEAEAAVSGLSAKAKAGSIVALAATDVVIGRIYVDADYGGSVHVYTAPTGCDSDPDMDKSRTIPSGWNDVVSSFKGYHACQLKIWDNVDTQGASFGPATNAPTVGAMNDRASSVSFH